jgi:adenine-specific DNA-methyltransferase
MAVINDLIDRISDPELRRRINDEVVRLQQQKKFGLVFEEHLPEATPLYDVPIKVKSLVARKDGYFKEFFRVKRIKGETLICEREDDSHEEVELSKNEAVAVALFGQPIYPYLKPLDAVKNAPDSDLWHTLIEADNYHALQLLVYLYGGMVDCIYIDPPYNTGAKDWKYNNDYVEATDSYKHSKWLSMIKKRLLLAKQLLNPKNSVLIVTIDEKEYLRLGCLLEEIFSEADIQMISSVIMPSGSSRTGRFGRADEYIYFCFLGESNVTPWRTDMLRDAPDNNVPVRWNGLIRNGEGSRRSRIPSLFYPILLNKSTGELVSIEDPIPPDMMVEKYPVPEGLVAMWPIDKAGNELMWRLYPPTLREYFRLGYAKLGKRDKKTGYRPVSYLQSGMIDKIKAGQILVIGKDKEGALELEYAEGGKSYAPLTVWNRVSHSAAEHGSGILKKILLNRHFPFPKSIYAIEDCLRFVVANKPNALIVDFFAGSGTTLQAVNLLNAEDGGNRRCIMVTNNEVSEAEAKSLRKQGYQPGDEEWEKYGIARYVNWPRTVCSIEGHDINGQPLKGNYLGSDKPMQEGFKANAQFLKLGFLDKNSVAAYRQFRELLPLLWMKAGAIGECPTLKGKEIPEYLILTENKMAILAEEWAYAKFIDEMNYRQDIKTVFLVVDSEIGFREMAAPLKWAKTYQLYKDYLENFTINYEK